MTANHTVPPIAYGAIYEEETMGTRERERDDKILNGELGVVARHLRELGDTYMASVVDEAAARLEGGEVLAKGWTSRVWSDASGHPIEVWQKGSKENGDIPVALVRRREGAMSETRTVTIYGASDDLVETSGVPGCDEFGAYSAKDGVNASFVLAGPGGSMRILAMYGPAKTACWAFVPMQVAEGEPFPDWPMRIHSGDPARGYSTVLEIEVPKGTNLIREELR